MEYPGVVGEQYLKESGAMYEVRECMNMCEALLGPSRVSLGFRSHAIFSPSHPGTSMIVGCPLHCAAQERIWF